MNDILQFFIKRGAVDSYDPVFRTLPELLLDITFEYAAIALFLLFLLLNKNTRIFTIAGIALLIIV